MLDTPRRLRLCVVIQLRSGALWRSVKNDTAQRITLRQAVAQRGTRTRNGNVGEKCR